MTWADEKDLWAFLAPRLRGKWSRLEAGYPSGMPDAFGLWRRQTHWLELKVGPPDRRAFETDQVTFGFDCVRHKVPWFVCFGYRGVPIFFDTPALIEPRSPPFWVEKPKAKD